MLWHTVAVREFGILNFTVKSWVGCDDVVATVEMSAQCLRCESGVFA